MDTFEWVVPTRFVFGRGVEDGVGAWATRTGHTSALLVYGGHHAQAEGLVARVRSSLEGAGLACCEHGGVRPNPEVGSVREAVRLARLHHVDLVVALGGGSVIDCSKACAMGVLHDGDVWDLFDKPHPAAPTGALDVAAIPTIPASGSEASDSCVISCDERGLKSSCHGDLIRPKVAFLDPELTLELPPYQTAAGITDICAHIFERFFSATGEVATTDGISLSLLRSVRAAAFRVMRDPHDYDARAQVMWAGTLAHDGLCSAGRAQDWASHGLEHELSAMRPEVTHGAGLAVIFPAWMRYCASEHPERLCELGREVFGLVPTGDAAADAASAIDATQDFFCSLGMPRYLDDLGFVPDDVERFLPGLAINKGTEFGSFRRLGAEDARRIYLSAFRPC
ncbi:MAG: iron-containing alcohol dehydrogenase [Atopobiaceae bacterium]|jgi:alcohol dehydrogenase YqhD (iron-dependent ADH family)|nr:iron-containing alcohol dehydrogenase [Atopobiaceae bacterium]MCH4181069.1 iron-containing alcohol dehydrogenase [Atopobiaceae bacterium]MCH4213435.1 iron-containing alcohol dehydrogenase [Atopobiaceae bacterium]MCH4230470.1 iron-containing alcohol dehydrogenase [Atopobiaceae bacterium]MCH4277072.1 iron-containing alcohol dehydrogenase [Atopobiaceae bacterium]